jgi:excinuclease ABC subunit C
MAPPDDSPVAPPSLPDLLERLPHQPGVYLLKDAQGTVIYVGKAKSLFSRVRSYFSRAGGDGRAFVPLLGELCADVETIVTHNEKEALLVENTLIKKHHPRFNVKLRDDKNFLCLRLDTRVPYPRLELTRRIKEDGARYFGPYHSATDARQTLRIVNRYFQLRTCSDRAMQKRKRACLQCQIKRCLAPCVCEVDPQVYAQQVEDVTLFLRGRHAQLLDDLERRMREAAAALDYETAARIRDQIAAVRSSLQSQQAVSRELGDQDVLGFYREGDRVEVVVLEVRGGKLGGRRPFALEEQELPDDELLSEFVSRYYDRGARAVFVPRQILVPLAFEDLAVKKQWLSDLRGGAVEILRPQRGEKRRLLELAERNAQSSFVSRRQQTADALEALGKLQRRLRLGQLPRRIECFDISSHQGTEVVGSMAVLVDGAPHRASYRRFKVSSTPRDDFAAMYEVLSRRLRRARLPEEDGSGKWKLPDLLVIDGGRQHLSMALLALRDAGLTEGAGGLDVVALAKERPDGTAGPATEERPDRVFLPHVKDPIRLRPNTTELFLLSRVRDEAHRFAIGYHRKLRHQRTLRSALDDIPGIGPGRRKALLRGLGSLKGVREASVEELAAVPGMSQKAAEAVATYFSARPPAEEGS